LAAAIPTLVSWKDGQGDIRRYQMIMNRVGDRLRWIGGAGDDLVPAYYRLGIRCYTSSLSNISPKLSLEIHDAASRNNSERLQHLMSSYIIPHYAFRARRKGYEVAVVKAMMNIIGLAGGLVRPPLMNVTEDEMSELKALLSAWQEVL